MAWGLLTTLRIADRKVYDMWIITKNKERVWDACTHETEASAREHVAKLEANRLRRNTAYHEWKASGKFQRGDAFIYRLDEEPYGCEQV